MIPHMHAGTFETPLIFFNFQKMYCSKIVLIMVPCLLKHIEFKKNK